MAPTDNLVWFITGANSGFGLLLSQLALSQGHIVIATARSLTKFPKSLQDNPKVDLVEIEITATPSEISTAVDAVVAKHGRLDVLVNNAGFGHLGAVEELTEQEARYQFDVNFFGLLNFTKAAIPHMRKQGFGIILQISSAAGILAGHGGPVYAASKFAVEGLSEGMAAELKPFGIRVHIVEPGIFRTEFLRASAEGKNIGQKKEGYFDVGGILGALHGKQPGNPSVGIQRIYEVVTSSGMGVGLESQLRIPLGSDCIGMFQEKANSLEETILKMKDIATSTDY
ncbi:Fc.00g010770.m01.CDS01 [Cosmosporella sp. VM-42]